MNTAGEAAECSDGSEVSAGTNHDLIDIANEIARAKKRDIAYEISHPTKKGHAFKKFRTDLKGDGSIEYRCCEDRSQDVTISSEVMDKLKSMMDRSEIDNLERPFFVIFDEERLCCVDVVVGEAGDEGYCEHSRTLVDESFSRLNLLQQTVSSTLLLSRGHTHPVCYPDATRAHGGLDSYSRRQQETTKYGALPSNVKAHLDEWQARHRQALDTKSPAFSPARAEAISQIFKNRMYKKYCDDYVESYHSSHAKGFNGGAASEAFGSRFHWIITPRLKQIGVFEVPKDECGVVVYHHWLLVEAITSHPVSSVPATIHAAALHHCPTRDGPPNLSVPSNIVAAENLEDLDEA